MSETCGKDSPSPLRIALLYALFGTVWIVSSSWLLPLNASVAAENVTLFELVKGLGFIAVTSLLLYLLLVRHSRLGGTATEGQGALTLADSRKRLILLLTALLLFVPLLLLLIVLKEAPRFEREAYKELQSIAELKSGQIVSWLDERHRDGMSLSEDPDFVRQVASALASDRKEAWEVLHRRLGSFRDAYRYRSVSLIDPAGEVRMQLGPPHDAGTSRSPAPDSGLTHDHHIDMMSGEVLTWEHPTGHELIHHSHDIHGVHMHFSFGLQVTPHEVPLATLQLDIEPERFLFPYITRWTTASASGETLLAEAANDRVLFLTPLRHKPAQPGTLTHPLSDSTLPAAIALRSGDSGTFRGNDYRGVEVVAAYHPVAGTPWQLIAKLDRAEVVAPLYNLLFWVGSITLIAVMLIGLLLLHSGRQQQLVATLRIDAERHRGDTLLQQFFDLPFIGIAITTPQSEQWLRFNDRLCEILGYSHDELAEMSWSELTHPDDRTADAAEFDKVMRGQSDGYSRDKRLLRKDGTVVDAYVDIKCIRNADGAVDNVVTMVQDISERKHKERQLVQARNEAQHYLDIAGVIMISLDSAGRIQLINQRACDILGYAEQELLDRDWFETSVPQARREEVRAVFDSLIAGEVEAVEYVENPVLTRSGEERLITWHNIAVRDDSGAVTGILSSGEDITELRRSEARLRTLVDTIPDLVWLKDSEGVYLACNPMFERFFGASEAAIVGKTDYDFVDQELADFFREHDRKAMAAGAPSSNEESFTFAADGYRGTFETLKTPMRDQEGKLIGVLGIARDITERKEATARIAHLSRLYATLSQTNQAIVRSRDEDELFAQVCRNAVEYGGFAMAWVGLFDPDSGSIKPVSRYGDDTGYLETLSLSSDPNQPQGGGPSAAAVREGEPYWCKDLLHDANMRPWHDSARDAGFAASAALPIRRGGQVIGAFNIYAGKAEAFDPAARELLLEMTVDISFALDHLEQEKQRDEAEERLELVIKGSQDAPWDWDLEADRFWYSPQWWQMLGYAADELPADSKLWRQLTHPDDLPAVDAALALILQPGHEWDELECRFRHKKGHYIPTLIRGFASRDEADRAVRLSGTISDLSERKRTEEQLHKQLDELNRWYDATLGREGRVLELKQEINRLLEQSGEPPRYVTAAPSTMEMDNDTQEQ